MPSAAILAGGRATRFEGRDKSGILVGGRPILDRQLEALEQISDDVMIAGRSPSTARPGDGRIRVLEDRIPGCGPLAGIEAALAAARHRVLVVVACDMPFVGAAFLEYLAGLADAADAVVPVTEDGYHPLCAAYTRGCLPAVERRLAAGQLAVRGLLDELKLRIVTSEEIERFANPAQLLANVNTPAALAEIETLQVHET